MGFYFSLFIFIISLIIGLAIMIAGKNMRRDKFMLLTSLHVIFLFGFLASLLFQKSQGIVSNNYFFTAYICSGIIMSGLSWRSESPKILRIYFSIFALTIPVFLISPSLLLNFLVTMNFKSTNGPEFHLIDKYYLETQSTTRKADNFPHYKLIQKKGMFHQNIQRDISFNGKIDSVKVISIAKGKSILLRGYTSNRTYVSLDIDSTEVEVPLRVIRQGELEYHL
jgi:hypothetical protein